MAPKKDREFTVEDLVPPSHPLYLHPGNNPGTILVTELFNGSNYVDWSRSMKTALLAKNKLGFLDGSVKKATDPNDLTYNLWDRCDGMVVSWLRNSTIPKIKSSLMFLDSASKIWIDLKERFSQGNVARIYELKQQLSNLRQGSNSINVYYTDLRVIWDEYLDYQPKTWCTCVTCKCGGSQKWRDNLDKELSVQFLMGLNESYSALRSSFLSTEPFPKLSKIFALTLQEERQKGLGHVVVKSHVVQSDSTGFVNVAGNFGRGKPFCTHCKRSNHTVDKCFQLHGFPPSMGRGRGMVRGGHTGTQRSVNSMEAKVNSTDGHSSSKTSSPFHPSSLSSDQYHQLLSYIQSQMQGQSLNMDNAPTQSFQPPLGSSDPSPTFSGSFKGSDDWDG